MKVNIFVVLVIVGLVSYAEAKQNKCVNNVEQRIDNAVQMLLGKLEKVPLKEWKYNQHDKVEHFITAEGGRKGVYRITIDYMGNIVIDRMTISSLKYSDRAIKLYNKIKCHKFKSPELELMEKILGI